MKQYIRLAVPLLIAAACTNGGEPSPTAPALKLASARPSAASISITSLPSLGGSSTARAINDDQVIVGSSNGLPVKWTLLASGSWRVQPLQTTSGAAEDITELGVIVGSSGGSVVLWTPGSDVVEIVGVGSPRAINSEAKVVVGVDPSAAVGTGARAWTRSGASWVPHVLLSGPPFTGGYSEPLDINDDSVIVGFAAPPGGSTYAVKWVPSATTRGEWDAAVPLDEFAAASPGGANAIVGQDIVGEVLRCFPCSRPTRDPYHWSLTAGRGIGSLGTQDAWAEGLNAEGSIVGSFFYRGVHAFVWTVVNRTIRDLGAPNGYQSASAYDINSPKGTRTTSQAVGQATGRKGMTAAVLWTLP
jgi:hypothetical protein